MNMMKYLKNYIINLICLLGIMYGSISFDQAFTIANNFIKEKIPDYQNYQIDSYFLDSNNNIANFYVINLNPEGFIDS